MNNDHAKSSKNTDSYCPHYGAKLNCTASAAADISGNSAEFEDELGLTSDGISTTLTLAAETQLQ